jgi:hypothetical protein
VAESLTKKGEKDETSRMENSGGDNRTRNCKGSRPVSSRIAANVLGIRAVALGTHWPRCGG